MEIANFNNADAEACPNRSENRRSRLFWAATLSSVLAHLGFLLLPSLEKSPAPRVQTSTISVQLNFSTSRPQAPVEPLAEPEAPANDTPVAESEPAPPATAPPPTPRPPPTKPAEPRQSVAKAPTPPTEPETPPTPDTQQMKPAVTTLRVQDAPAVEPPKKRLLDSALGYARDNATADDDEATPKHFDRRLDQALTDAKIYNQEGEYPPDAVESFEDSAGRRFVKVQGGGCFELVAGEMNRRKGDVWYFSDGCGGSDDDKIQIDFKNLN